MSEVFSLVSVLLYGAIGLIALSMVFRCLSARKYMPFHEAAAGTSWSELGDGLKVVILALLRQTGLGFLITGLLLFVSAAANLVSRSAALLFLPALLALQFCLGLFFVNRQLTLQRGVPTRAKESLFAAIGIAVGLVLSVAARCTT